MEIIYSKIRQVNLENTFYSLSDKGLSQEEVEKNRSLYKKRVEEAYYDFLNIHDPGDLSKSSLQSVNKN